MQNHGRVILLVFAAIFLCSTSSVVVAEELCSPSNTETTTVCNLGWKELCKEVARVETSTCQALNANFPEFSGYKKGGSDGSAASDLLVAIFDALAQITPFPAQVIEPVKVTLLTATNVSLNKSTVEISQKILDALDSNSFDASAQGEARKIIRDCSAKPSVKTVSDMFVCSGFFVPSMVRLNCLSNGPCYPLPWGKEGIANGNQEWWSWQSYEAASVNVETAAVVRPWVAKPEEIDSCREASKGAGGAVNAKEFSGCLVNKMGGSSAHLVTSCYRTWSTSPVQFAACIGGVTVEKDALIQAQCVIDKDFSSQKCLTALGISKPDVITCLAATGNDIQKYRACLGNDLSKISQPALCAMTYGGDSSMLGHCLNGIAKVAESSVSKCASTMMQQGKLSGSTLQISLLSCAGQSDGGTKESLSALVNAKGVIDCLNNPSSEYSAKVTCMRNAGAKFPKEVELANCVANAKEALEAAECAGIKGATQIKAAKQCMEQGAGNSSKQALCLGAVAGLPPEQANVVSCAATANSFVEGAVCMAGPQLPKDTALALQCAAESQGSAVGTAICMAGPQMNAELRIAAECIASTGGEPVSFAGCAGGRLTMKELQQCIAGGFKAENGCFGENNEVVKFYAEQEKVLRSVLKAAGLESAYNNLLSDLKSGKLGENNDARRAMELVNRVALQEPQKAAEAIGAELAKSGKQIEGGVAHLAQELNKASESIGDAVKNALPQVPAPKVTAKTDLPGGGNAEVSVSTGGAEVRVGNSGAVFKPDKGSVNISVGGVCVGFGC